jgi:hypothetical protein
MFHTFSNEDQNREKDLWYFIGTISVGVKLVVLIELTSVKIKSLPGGIHTRMISPGN